MRQLLSSLVEILSSLGLWFGQLRQSQRVFAGLANETDAVAAQLEGAIATDGEVDLPALVRRLRDVALATEDAATRSASELDRIRSGLLRATTLAAEMTGDVVRTTPGGGAAAAPAETSTTDARAAGAGADPLERQLRGLILEGRQERGAAS